LASNLLERVSGTDHYLVVAKLRERLLVSKQATQRFDMQRILSQEAKGTVSGQYVRSEVLKAVKMSIETVFFSKTLVST
jgi:hypothetical protein